MDNIKSLLQAAEPAPAPAPVLALVPAPVPAPVRYFMIDQLIADIRWPMMPIWPEGNTKEFDQIFGGIKPSDELKWAINICTIGYVPRKFHKKRKRESDTKFKCDPFICTNRFRRIYDADSRSYIVVNICENSKLYHTQDYHSLQAGLGETSIEEAHYAIPPMRSRGRNDTETMVYPFCNKCYLHMRKAKLGAPFSVQQALSLYRASLENPASISSYAYNQACLLEQRIENAKNYNEPVVPKHRRVHKKKTP